MKRTLYTYKSSRPFTYKSSRPLKATLGNEVSNAKNLQGTKETVSHKTLVVMHKGEMKTVVSARWYKGRSRYASTMLCSLWVYGDNYYTSGHGQAGGGGYCKSSAALYWAAKDANIELSRSTSGTGEMDETLIAIAKGMGYRGQFVIV